jgi:HD-GYP domain-containing protein (c-di-GMP phosphodiesterase class II)
MNQLNENKAVGMLSEIMALERGYTHAKARMIRKAATLHDIGKIKIDGSILNKDGRLNPHEFLVLKSHTWLGAKMLLSIQGELGEAARLCCLMHHEWHNGRGYWNMPACYLPEFISFVSIADVYTALITERPYKAACPMEGALGYIQNQAGTQFSPELVKDFVWLIRNDSRVQDIFFGKDDVS